MNKEDRYKAAQWVIYVGVVVNVALAAGKVVAGVMGRSAAMVADGIHSISDLVTDAAVLLGMRIAKQPADEDHPYGHGKFETLATQFVSIALLVVAVGIFWDAAERIRRPDLEAPTAIALVAALFSLLSKEALFHYTIRAGRRLDAKALIANAWHHRSDAVSSIAAFIGIAGAMMGWPILDPLAAMAVAVILGKVGVDLFKEAFHELTDSTSVIEKEIQERITALVHDVSEVHSAHFVTPRRLGPDILVDVHVVVDPFLSVSEGHRIAEKVRQSLLSQVEAVTDVMVHVDVEEDEAGTEPVAIPMERNELMALVNREINSHETIVGVNRLLPHYTGKGIVLELVLEVDDEHPQTRIHMDAEALCARLLASGNNIEHVLTSLSSAQARSPVSVEGPRAEINGE